MIKIPKFAILGPTLGLLLLLNSCSTRSIEGEYKLGGRGWFAGESVTLGATGFEYDWFTDNLDDPNYDTYPVRGNYTVEGENITLHHPKVLNPTRVIPKRIGSHIMFTPEQYQKFLDTDIVPYNVLYQRRKSTAR